MHLKCFIPFEGASEGLFDARLPLDLKPPGADPAPETVRTVRNGVTARKGSMRIFYLCKNPPDQIGAELHICPGTNHLSRSCIRMKSVESGSSPAPNTGANALQGREKCACISEADALPRGGALGRGCALNHKPAHRLRS